MPTADELAAMARNNAGTNAMLMQIAPIIAKTLARIQPLLDQPIIRMPYNFPLANTATLSAGQTGVPLAETDFLNALEWPFEIHKIKFSQDASHTARDWRVTIQDQTFNQNFMKNSTLVADLIDNNTGSWDISNYPWIARPKGGGIKVTADNLDASNPIQVDINFIGYLMIPRSR